MPTEYWQPFIDMQNLAKGEEELQYARESRPARLKLLDAQARMQSQQADEKEEESEIMRGAANLVRLASESGEEVSPIEGVRMQADHLSRMGRPQAAMDLLGKIELAESRDQRQKLQDTQMKRIEEQLAFQQAQHIEQALGNVTSQEQLDDAIMTFESVFQEQVPDAYRTYSPQMIETVRRNAMSVKDRITMGIREAELRRREAKDKDTAEAQRRDAAVKEQRARTAERSMEIRSDREQRLRKEGAGPGSKSGGIVPPKGMVDHAISAIRDMYPDLTIDQAKHFARDSAADAQAAIKSNPGIDMKAAVYAAVEKNAKNIESQMEGGILGIGGTKRNKYHAMGSSEKNPMTMPDSVSKLIPGRYYRDANGVVKQYNPKGK